MSASIKYGTSRSRLVKSLLFVRARNGLLITLLVLMVFVVTITSVRGNAYAAAGPTLSVDATAASYPINPNIYGACGSQNLDANFAREISLPLCRWGGDATSRYNWQVNATNSGTDFWFLGGASNPSADTFIDNNYGVGANSLITIPMIPYIEKSTDNLCAFSVKKYGWDNVGGYGAFWFDYNGQGKNGHDGNYDCADGVTTNGQQNFTSNDPHDTSTENSPDIQKAWVQHLVQKYGPSSQSHILYELDNEPSNWGYLHRDVYRTFPTSYDDLINYTEQYAPAIKAADPTAQILGPNDLGFAWQGNDANMIKYLQAMQQYEQQHGQRILDIFSEHYPSATNGDIDHVRKLVDQYYPGTGIGFDEWNQGGDPVATASTLGQFARDRVSEAAYWTFTDGGDPTKPPAYAFRMFRNYDGQGSQFGDTYLQSTSSNDSQLSVYGAKRSSDGAITIIVTNPTANDLSSPLNLNGINPSGNARVYTYASNINATTIIRQPDQSVSSSGFTYTYPAHSITMVAIPTGNGWTTCANEGGTCTFTGTQVVRYGANGKFAYQTATGSIGCNNSVFGDPNVGTVKSCSTAPVPPSSWTKCADEGGTCTVSGTVTVAYGASSKFAYQSVTGSITCNNSTFGDPIPGTAKACYYLPTSSGFTVDGNGTVGNGTGLSGVYYNSTDLSGNPVADRTDSQLNFTWDGNTQPAPGVNGQNFSVRWSGQLQATVTGNYTFSTVSDDGIRLWLNGQKVIDDWTNHASTTDTSASIFLIAGVKYGVKIEYFNGCCSGTARLSWTPPNQSQQVIPTSQLYPAGSGTGLTGAYYNSTDFSTPVVVTRIDAQVDFTWDGNTQPAPGVNGQNFGVHWTGELLAPVSGNYQFATVSDDGIRLLVNGQKVIDDWVAHGAKTDTSTSISLTAGKKYSIAIDYYNGCCGGTASLQWIPPGGTQQVIPQGNLFAQ